MEEHMARKIEIIEYNPDWKNAFKEESKKIKNILEKNNRGIHHIGSTSVKGMKAVPAIDMMVIVKDISLVRAQLSKFDALGYRFENENEELIFTKEDGRVGFKLYVYEEKQKLVTSKHLAMRAYLQGHPEDVKEYSDLKVQIAEEVDNNPEEYKRRKGAYLNELEKKASEWTESQMQQGNYTSMGMCMGMAIGMAIGSAFGNMTTGMCMGLAVGVCVGTAIGASKAKK